MPFLLSNTIQRKYESQEEELVVHFFAAFPQYSCIQKRIDKRIVMQRTEQKKPISLTEWESRERREEDRAATDGS